MSTCPAILPFSVSLYVYGKIYDPNLPRKDREGHESSHEPVVDVDALKLNILGPCVPVVVDWDIVPINTIVFPDHIDGRIDSFFDFRDA